MGEHIKKCMENMAVNAELYRQIAETKKLQEWSEEYRIAKAQQNAWQSACDMLAEAIEREEKDNG